MARVFRAGLRGLAGFEKKLVVKQILPELASDPRFVELFVREATTVVSLSHPHIVPVYDLGLVDGVYFLSMEYVEGATLAEVLRSGPLSPALAAHVGAQLADALAYAHGRGGLVHRDVTPRNIMLDSGGHARLLDFGIAAPVEDAEGGEVFGSPGYMSPEQARGDAVDGRSDVFSLATSLYRALTGEEAFQRPGAGETRAALMAEQRPSLAGVVDDEVARCLEAALALRAEDRPDAQALGRSLRSWLSSEHPEGVTEELGARAETASLRTRDTRDADEDEDDHADDGPRTKSASVEVQTLATRPAFAAMLQDEPEEPSTRRMETRDGDVAAKAPAVRDGDVAAKAPAVRDGDVAAKAPAVGDGDVAAKAPAVGDGDVAAKAPAVRDGDLEPVPTSTPRSRAWVLGVIALSAAAAAIAFAPTTPDATPPAARTETRPPIAEDAAVQQLADAAALPGLPADAGESVHADAARSPTPERPMATLTITATPWATVRVDGRDVGTTPLRSHRVSAGNHTLSFDNPPLGRSLNRHVHVVGGRSLWIRVDLSRDPPSVVER